MKLHGFVLSAALAAAGSEAAEQHPVEAYVLSQSQLQSSTSTELSSDLAEAILLQRLGSSASLGHQLSYNEDAIAQINSLGKTPQPLFSEASADEPHQLVVSFTGVTPDRYESIKEALPQVPLGFTAKGLAAPLPVKANKRFCPFAKAIDPSQKGCWTGRTQYLHYDVSEDTTAIAQAANNLATLQSLAKDGEMETVFVISSPTASQLARRYFPEADTDDEDFVASSKPEDAGQSAAHAFASPGAKYEYCYDSEEACVEATSGCSGHGDCNNRWRDSDSQVCFACQCKITEETDDKGRTSRYKWGGGACQKRDVSVPFWMFFGVTLTLLGTVAFSISLLYSIGEEKLPGVIGAGVSKSK